MQRAVAGRAAAPRAAAPSPLTRPRAAPGSLRGLAAAPRRAVIARAKPARDPYSILGVPRGAPAQSIERAYRRRLAESRSPAERSAVETAHTSVMMEQFRARVQGKAVDPSVRFADRAVVLPWKPRRHEGGPLLSKASLGVQVALALWALATPRAAGTKPVLYSACIAGLLNILKQNVLRPPEDGAPGSGSSSSSGGSSSNQGLWNVLRGFFLAGLATFGGCLLAYTLPDAVLTLLQAPKPQWFVGGQTINLAIGAAVANHIMTKYYR